jgi:hypothetical protein
MYKNMAIEKIGQLWLLESLKANESFNIQKILI